MPRFTQALSLPEQTAPVAQPGRVLVYAKTDGLYVKAPSGVELGPVDARYDLGAANVGAWSSTVPYVKGQIVTRNGKVFIASVAPAVGVEPGNEAQGAPEIAGSVDTNGTSAGAYGAVDLALPFTVNTATAITAFEVVFASGSTAASFDVGVASSLGANSASTVFIGASSLVTREAGAGFKRFTLNASVTVQPGTTYYLVARGVSGGNMSQADYDANLAAVAGVVATASGGSYTTSAGGAWTASGFGTAFRVFAPGALAWKELPFGGSFATRTTASRTTTSLATGAQEVDTIALAAGYRVYALQVDRACRVRLYSSTAKRDADTARAIGTDPPANSGLILEYVATAAGTYELSPVVDGYTSNASTAAAIAITNTAAQATVTATLTYLRTE